MLMLTRTRMSGWLAALVCAGWASGATAKDLWVMPTHVETAVLNGIWPETGAGLARFAFAVPPDMQSMVSVRLVFLPAETVLTTYNLYADVKRDGETLSLDELASQLNVDVAFTANVLTEVDVSGALAGLLDGSSSGNDLVSLLVFTGPESIATARIFGLRFVYEALPLDTARFGNGAVTSASIADGTIATDDLANGGVSSAAIADSSVTGAHVADESLTGSQVQNRAVGGIDLAVGSVSGGEIANGAIALVDLASSSVNGSRIVDGAVVSAHVTPLAGADVAPRSLTSLDVAVGSVTGAEIQNGSVTSIEIANGTIVNADLANGAVNGAKVAPNSLTGADVQDGTLTANDISFIRGLELSSLRTVQVQCQGIAGCNSTLGQVCDIAGAGWEPFGISNAHNFGDGGNVPCGGDNLCTTSGLRVVDRDEMLFNSCDDGGGGDCVVYCIAP